MNRLLFPLLLLPVVALAHGGYPIANEVYFVDRGGASEPVLETTFGLAHRDDDGTWRLTCEEGISPGVKWWLVERDGSIGMGHATGYARSSDGCTFTPSIGISNAVRYLTRAPAYDGTRPILALIDLYDPGTNLRLSLDGGATFDRVAYGDDLLVTALRADPDTPGRLLASGQDADRFFHLLESKDLGKTWSRTPIEIEDGAGFPRIFAITKGALFIRRTTLDTNDLWRSVDGGATWAKVLDNANVQATFLAELASGDLWLGAGAGKTFRSTDGGATWVIQAEARELTCMKEDSGKLWACTVDVTGNAGLLVSTDAGATFEPYFKYDTIVSMAKCPATSTIGAVCEDYWLLVKTAIKSNGDQPPVTEPPPGVDTGWCTHAPVGGLGVFVFALKRRRFRA